MGFPIAIAVAVAVLVAAEFAEQRALRMAAKFLASLGFMAFAEQLGLDDGTAAQQWVFWGLALGMLGDLCLLSRQSRFFLLGLGAFLLNHVAYVGAFLLLGVHGVATAIAALGLGAFGYGVWRWLEPHVGGMRMPVVAYIVVIVSMVACAVGHAVESGSVGLLLAAILFFTSDLCVARDRFISPGPWNRLVGLPLYYAGQIGFALAAASSS